MLASRTADRLVPGRESCFPHRAFGGGAGRRFAAGVLWSGAEIKRGSGRGTRAAVLALNQGKQPGLGADEHKPALADSCRERSFATVARVSESVAMLPAPSETSK